MDISDKENTLNFCQEELNKLYIEFIEPVINGKISTELMYDNEVNKKTIIRCSLETYNEIKLDNRKVALNDSLVYTCTYTCLKLLKQIINKISKEYNINYLSLSNKLLYYKNNGYMGWHTNINTPGDRWYLVYNTHDNSSFFRYIDPETNEMITKWEPKGWSINHFVIGKKDKPLWHCIYTSEIRISIGMKINKLAYNFKFENIILN